MKMKEFAIDRAFVRESLNLYRVLNYQLIWAETPDITFFLWR